MLCLIVLYNISLGTQRCPLLKVNSAVYPHFLLGNLIFAIKVDPLNLDYQNQVKNISVGLSSSLIKIWGKSISI